MGLAILGMCFIASLTDGKALEWYNSEEYKPIKPIRLANSEANGIIIKGV